MLILSKLMAHMLCPLEDVNLTSTFRISTKLEKFSSILNWLKNKPTKNTIAEESILIRPITLRILNKKASRGFKKE